MGSGLRVLVGVEIKGSFSSCGFFSSLGLPKSSQPWSPHIWPINQICLTVIYSAQEQRYGLTVILVPFQPVWFALAPMAFAEWATVQPWCYSCLSSKKHFLQISIPTDKASYVNMAILDFLNANVRLLIWVWKHFWMHSFIFGNLCSWRLLFM